MPDTPASVTTPGLDGAAIAYALARNECGERLPLRDVFMALGVDFASPGLKALMKSEGFRNRLAAYMKELRDTGESFKLKARVQAEELLAVQWSIVQDPETPASVRMQGIQNVVEWADLKPRKSVESPGAPPSISIHIDLGGEAPEIIDVTPPLPLIPLIPA